MSGATVQDRPPLARLHQAPAPLRGKIIDALRAAIETGVLAPGQRLVEKTLCEQLAVSRTSLREALRELQADGILDSTGRGLSVRHISAAEAHNIYRLRAVIEALVVEQFIEQATPAQMAALAQDAHALQAAYTAGDVRQILAAKRVFYDRICEGAGNAVAFDMIHRLVLRTSALRARSVSRRQRQDQSVREIAALVTAIHARDAAAARAAALAHVGNAAASALESG